MLIRNHVGGGGFFRFFLFCGAIVATTITAQAQSDVMEYGLTEIADYVQTDASTVTPDPSQPYQFGGSVSAVSPAVILPSSTLTTPAGGAGVLTPQISPSQPGNAYYEADFATLPAMNAAFPTGTYTFSVQTSTPNSYTFTQALLSGSFPSAPQITSTINATWTGGVLQVSDVTQPTTLNWPAFTSNNGNITFRIDGANFSQGFAADGTNAGTVIPANTLANNTTYIAVLGFSNNSASSSSSGPNASVGFQSNLTFIIQTGTPSGSSKMSYQVLKTHVLTQTSNSAPANISAALASLTDPAPYSFSAQSPVAGTTSGPGAGSPYTLNFSAYQDNYFYSSGPEPTTTALNSGYPDGSYTLADSNTVTLTGDVYPNASTPPQVTQVNGTTPMWDGLGRLVLNPSVTNTLTLTAYSGSNSNYSFATGGMETFTIQDFIAGSNVLKMQAGVGQSSATPFTTVVIPASTLTQGNTYLGAIKYLLASDVSQPSSNVYDVAGYVTKTGFKVVAAAPGTVSQTINFATLPDRLFGSAPFDLTATASSNLPVTFSIVSGPATVSGNVLTITGTGMVTVQASQAGNATYAPISVSQSFNVTSGTASVTLSGLTAVYTGNPISVTAVTKPAGLTVDITYNGNGTPPTDAGSYPVVATIDDPNYAGSATGTLVIAKATAKVTLQNLAAVYTGSPISATATTTPSGPTVNFTYGGSPTPPTSPGTYLVVGTIDDPNYQGMATGTLVVSKAPATVTFVTLTATYDGSPQEATATTNPSDLELVFTYNGSTTAPTAVGNYALVATVNEADFSGKATSTFTISKAAATVTLTPASLSATYTGHTIAAAATTIPPGLPVTFAYTQNGKTAAPINAGSYNVTATVNTANAAGSASGTLVISPAAETVTVNSVTTPYTGKPIAATAMTSPTVKLPVSFTYQLGGGSPVATPPTALGSYAVVGTISNPNYSGSGNGTLTIVNPPVIATSPATPLLSAFGAQVSFGVTPNGISTRVYFEYATNPAFNLDSAIPSEVIGSGKTQVMVTGLLTGLEPDTLYYYRIVVLTSVGVEYGPTETFTTLGFDTTQVAATGLAPADGLPTFATLGNAAIDDLDGVAFNAKISSTSTTSNDGIWANQGSSTLVLLAQTGATAPGTGGAVFATLSDPVLVYDGADEDVAFGGTLKVATGLVTTGNENGVWASSGGTVGLVAREGSVAPGTGGATFATFGSLGLTDSGDALFSATLTGSVTPNLNQGVWEVESGNLTLMLHGGEQTDTSKIIASFKFLPTETYVNGQTRGFGPTTGDLVANANYTDGSTGIVKVLTPATPLAVATSGDAAIGTTGATFATFSSPAINDSDDVAFAATLTVGVGDAVKANAGGIWADSAGTRALVARLGQVAPGLSTNATFTAFSDPVYNDEDAVAFRATLGTGTGQATTATDSGIWTDSGGPLALVAQQGTQAPGCPTGVNFLAFTELALDDVNGSGVMFLATLSGTGVTTANNMGIFAVDNTGTLQLIVRTGDVLNGETITALTFLPAETLVNGQARSFSASTGDLVYNATFSDKSQAIFNVVFP